MSKKRISEATAYLYLGILALLPFHAFLTTWAGSSWGGLDTWRIWKEVLIFVSGWAVLYLAWCDARLRAWLLQSWLVRAVLLYTGLGLLLGMLALAGNRVTNEALIYGLFVDFRFVVFMLLCAVVSFKSEVLLRWVRPGLLIPLTIVVIFGLVQLLLPLDFLRHFGYGPDTIPAYQTIDNKPEYQRIQSTLRGANPLGAYLIIGLSALVYWLRNDRQRVAIWSGLLGLTLLALFFSYSRSAYIGAAVAIAVVVLLNVSGAVRRKLLYGAAVGLVLGCATVFTLRNNDFVQNTLFHSDESSLSAESSNTGRARSMQAGFEDVITEPLGRGVGTAGPASTRNDAQPARIAENYFLQIGQELGWLGLGLFLLINVLVARQLWVLRSHAMAQWLLASFIGLTVVNILSHAWADDTLGLLWWGLAGIVIGRLHGDKR